MKRKRFGVEQIIAVMNPFTTDGIDAQLPQVDEVRPRITCINETELLLQDRGIRKFQPSEFSSLKRKKTPPGLRKPSLPSLEFARDELHLYSFRVVGSVIPKRLLVGVERGGGVAGVPGGILSLPRRSKESSCYGANVLARLLLKLSREVIGRFRLYQRSVLVRQYVRLKPCQLRCAEPFLVDDEAVVGALRKGRRRDNTPPRLEIQILACLRPRHC